MITVIKIMAGPLIIGFRLVNAAGQFLHSYESGYTEWKDGRGPGSVLDFRRFLQLLFHFGGSDAGLTSEVKEEEA